jgi:small conductance mechanosensitive channel
MDATWLKDIGEQLATWGGGLGNVLVVALRIGAIALVAWIIKRILHHTVRRLRLKLTDGIEDRESIQRAQTLGRVVRYLISVVVTLVATMLILSEVGISLAPILGAAGVVGLAVGFGAQSLVKDYFAGFFLLLENQIRQGDVVTLAGHTGLVEEVTLRYVQLRDYGGTVYFVPNGQITTVTNMTRGYANAVVDVGVAYREDVDEVMALMHKVAAELRQDPGFGPRILQDLEMAGVDQLADSAVVIRARLRCVALEQWDVRREYLRRVKKAFDAAGIEIPFPHLTVYAGEPKQGRAAPFRLDGAAVS